MLQIKEEKLWEWGGELPGLKWRELTREFYPFRIPSFMTLEMLLIS